MTVPFENLTDDGNEPALRRGRVVPEGAVNLAWAKSPKLSPAENVVIVDTSRVVEENVIDLSGRRKLYYANSLGILEDEAGNQLVDDEFPLVTDVFSVDEDFSSLPASEYRPEHILPFLHVSRYFHLDYIGLTLPGDLFEFREDILKVVDVRGRPYVDGDGRPRYKVRIASAVMTNPDPYTRQSAYRVYVYLDDDVREDLYLSYHKVELNNAGQLVREQLNYRELLNLRPVFDYVPEEAEVVDRPSWHKKIYSSKPISLKQQVLGIPFPNVDGYRLYVPKKAKGDPRIFQLFHWRVSCSFTKPYAIDANRVGQAIRAGVVVTNANNVSAAPYCLVNLQESGRNATDVLIENPLNSAATNLAAQKTAAYWNVNFDTVSFDQLQQFDFLVWAPTTPSFDFGPYLAKIDYFTRTLGGTLFIDTNNFTVPTGLGIETTRGVQPLFGFAQTPGPEGQTMVRPVGVAGNDPLIDGLNQLGGWPLIDGQNNDELQSLSWINQLYPAPYGWVQRILSHPSDWSVVVSANGQPVTVRKATGTGNIIFSTYAHLYSCSALFSATAAQLVSPNRGATMAAVADYQQCIDSPTVEGAMRFFNNALLLAVKGRAIDDIDQRSYSTSWSYQTDWETSWVIDASNDTLSQNERERHSFTLLPEDPLAATPLLSQVWKRRLADRTCKQLIDEELFADPVMRRRQEGSLREYHLEVTNAQVETESVILGDSPPYAWTRAYTPKFVVPVELGPNVVREEEVKGDYTAGQYEHRVYPPKPYGGIVQATYTETSEHLLQSLVSWTATGTAVETVQITTEFPATTTTSTSEVKLSWWDYPMTGSRQYIVTGLRPRQGYHTPRGIETWTEANYYTNDWGPGHLNWPFFGLTNRFQQGSSGEVVQFIQQALNGFLAAGYFGSGNGPVPTDGNYGSRTAAFVRDFQVAMGARYIDGVVDAETWSIIGFQCLRQNTSSGGRTDFFRFFDWPRGRLRLDHISDGNPHTPFAKRSWYSNGPAVIWDLFQVIFNQRYTIHGLTIVPYLEGQTRNLLFRSVRVGDSISMTGFNSVNSQLVYMPHRPVDGEHFRVNFGPYAGDSVIVGIGQDGPAGAGWGTARMMGVRDIYAHANVTSTLIVPGRTEVTQQTRTIPITSTGSLHVTAFRDEVRQASVFYTGAGQLSNVVWNNVAINTSDVTVSINSAGTITFQSRRVTLDSDTNFTFGPGLPGGTYYSMDDRKVLNPVREVGQISKADGVKLFCNLDRTPYGFPSVPSAIGPNETQRHFLSLALLPRGNDMTVTMGFYDVLRQEFIVNADGQPEMSYIEWVTRGTSNVYIAALSSYEQVGMKVVPVDDDAPKLPYRWAMPTYGVYKQGGARITLEALPPNLGLTDVWPVAVREGAFSREVLIRTRLEGFLTTWAKNYQGTAVRAFYSLPESGGWSTLHGPPCADVLGEEPEIIDDDVIRVRQPPFHLVAEPTQIAGHADPVRPAFTVYRRTIAGGAWVAQPWSEIADYNASTGEIFLKTPLTSDDPALLKVDYTTERRHYYFKRYGDALLNLNPYAGQLGDLVGQAIYIYIVPRYVRDATGALIGDSVVDDPLRFTTSPGIFDPIRPEHDPLAIQLGVVFVSAALELSDLVMLDTRRRGGGIKDSANAQEVARLVQEASAYWDVGYGTGASYQKGGYVIVRLPAELKTSFSEAEINASVERNLTAGVRFALEDLTGGSWS